MTQPTNKKTETSVIDAFFTKAEGSAPTAAPEAEPDDQQA